MCLCPCPSTSVCLTSEPVLLPVNGTLLNRFEDFFGDVRAWKGYPFDAPSYCERPVWRHLRKRVVKDISRILAVLSQLLHFVMVLLTAICSVVFRASI